MELDRRCRILVALLVLVWDRLSFCCRRVPCEKMHWSLMNWLLSPTVLPINDAKPTKPDTEPKWECRKRSKRVSLNRRRV